MSEGKKKPYSKTFAYTFKMGWALGERVMRVLLLNRCAPEVAGVERGIHYVPRGHRLQVLDVIKPLGDPPFPILVFIHGGTHHFGDKGTYERICKCFAAAGYLVFNCNYRMCPRWGFPEEVQDTATAVNWVYDNAPSYGGDNQRMFLGGDSAGAYFSVMYTGMALNEQTMRAIGVDRCIPAEVIRGLLLFYGIYDLETVVDTKFPFSKGITAGYLSLDPDLYQKRVKLASPIRHLSPAFPPCFIASSELDPAHSQTEELVHAMDEEGITYEYFNLTKRKYPLTYHGFLNFWFLRSAQRAMRGATEFLEGIQSDEPVASLAAHQGSRP